MRRILLPFLPCILAAQAVQEPAHIQTFQATAKAVCRGEAVTLRWSAAGVDKVRLDPLGLILPAKGELTQMVAGRMVYWLHVVNASGGQSLPLVVDVLPETPIHPEPAAPAPPPLPAAPQAPAAAPSVPPLVHSRDAVDTPKLASLPPLPSPSARVLRVSQPMTPALLEGGRPGRRRAWIQFAATLSPKSAARFQRTLQRFASTDSIVLARHRRAGRPFQLVRTGPFPSLQAARLRLQELAPAMQALKLKPIIILGPPQPISLGTTFIADSRQPQ